MPRKVDSYIQGKAAEHGKRPDQKLKPYVVLQYLLKYSDEDHPRSAQDIIGFLEECGILAERRSIYKDIEEINRVSLMMEEDCTLEEADEMLADADADDLKLVVYDNRHKGFYAKNRHYELDDIRLLIECVYASKFISEGQSKRLVDVLSDFVSVDQADSIRHNALLTDRNKTNNRSVLNNISLINQAMIRSQKISFKYLRYSIDDLERQVERRNGQKYIVSPYHLLINDGNYYLLAFSDKQKSMRTYRLDRIKDVSLFDEPREGKDEFRAMDIKSYAQRVFSMYSGKQRVVSLRFINPLLDTVIDRFGRQNVQYAKVDEGHFRVDVRVEISDQFFGWLLGFGKKVRIIAPDDIIDQFKAYIDKVREMYQEEKEQP